MDVARMVCIVQIILCFLWYIHLFSSNERLFDLFCLASGVKLCPKIEPVLEKYWDKSKYS